MEERGTRRHRVFREEFLQPKHPGRPPRRRRSYSLSTIRLSCSSCSPWPRIRPHPGQPPPTSNSRMSPRPSARSRCWENVSFDVLPGEMVCILGRSGVGKSVSLHNIRVVSQARFRPRHRCLPGHHLLHRAAARGDPQKSHHGFSEWSALRLAHRWGERGVPAAPKARTIEDQIFQAVDGLLEMVALKKCGRCCRLIFRPA